MRLIDADALRKEVRELPNENTDYFYMDVVDREVVQALISEAPTVDRPHGEWIFKNGKYRCSVCLEPCATFTLCTLNPRDNFCLWCGSDNRKEGEKE